MQRSRVCLYALGHVLLLALVSPSALAALWNDVPQASAVMQSAGDGANARPAGSVDFKQRLLNADPVNIRQQLLDASSAQARNAVATGGTIEFPMPDGSLRRYTVEDSPVMAAELADKYPEIKTYKVRALDAPAMSGRVSITPLGFHGYLDTEQGTVYIDPVRGSDAQQYRSFYKLDYALAHKDAMQPFRCGVHGSPEAGIPLPLSVDTAGKTAAKTENALRSFRIAIATTGEYSDAVTINKGDPKTTENVRTAIIVAIDRVNQIYERDLGVHLQYVINDKSIYLDKDADPYTNDNDSLLLEQNQANLDDPLVLGSANYDIGHVFSTGGGGLASLGVVCDSTRKARGETGLANPTGDPFYIDYVAHEIGHQFNAEHTFNGTTGSCGGANRNATTAVEPGSGSTVMSYAGICGGENIASAADAVFHGGSIEVIAAFTRTGAASGCAVDGLNAGNVAPAVNAGSNYTIPGGTPFELSGSATDTDSLLYHWDEMDVGVATTVATIGRDLGSNALFRSFEPSATGNSRSFPAQADILNGTTTLGETLPSESRTLNFRLTATDGKGGVDKDDMQVTVNGDAGPFKVLQPNSAVALDPASPQVIEWNAACSEQAPVSCANVDILYSDDGGNNFILLESTPNDGEHTVNLPAGTTTQARIKIKCSNNIFFDISDTNFTVSNAGVGLTSTGNGGSYNCGTSTGGQVGSDLEPNDSPSLANLITLPLSNSISGTVNNFSDPDDYYVFVGDGKTYNFNLGGYGTYDLDLFLLDALENEIRVSASEFSTTESFSATLASGEVYFVQVNAFNTLNQTSAYSLNITASTDSGGGGAMSLLNVLLFLLARLFLFSRKPLAQ